MKYHPHEVDWTPEKIRRFWDAYSANDALADSYFAKQLGHSVIRHAERHIRIGAAVDIGCGRGDLIFHLLRAGHRAAGMDQSPESVDRLWRRFGDSHLFAGAETHFPDGKFDTAFMLEVVEHMDDAALDAALGGARRLLKAGGSLIVTTPNEENLELSRDACPDCGCRFHRMQHVRSWSAASLSERMAAAGFRKISCAATSLTPRRGAIGAVDRLKNRLLGRCQNLIFIGAARS